jgi:hypothetical protein
MVRTMFNTASQKSRRSLPPPPTLENLADEYGKLKSSIDALRAQQDAVKGELLKSKKSRIDGQTYTITISRFSCTRLVSELVKGVLTPQQLIDCSRESDEVKLTVKHRV